MLTRKIEHAIAPRSDCLYLDTDPIDPPERIHVQLGDKAASHQANPDFRHEHAPMFRQW
jgi:hypothetical protein